MTTELDRAVRIAYEHHAAGRYSNAERICRQVLAAHPAHPGVLHLLGLLAQQAGRNATAVELIGKSLYHDPANAMAWNDLGIALSQLGRFREAEQSFRRALAQKPDYAEALNNLGNTFYALGLSGDAEREYLRALQLWPDAAVTHNNLGESVRFYSRALELKPSLVEAHNNLGKVLTDLGRYEEAERSLCTALNLKPDYAEAHNNLGTLFRRRGLLDKAVRSYSRALELMPNLAEAHNNLGITFQGRGEFGDAEKHYRLALGLAPSSIEALLHLGIFLHGVGSSEEAREHLRRALELSPDDAAARWAFAMSHLQIMPMTKHAAAESRETFARELSRLDDWFDANRLGDSYKAVGIQQPFYLAYQEEDNRELLSQYGNLCARLMSHWQLEQGLSMLPPASGTAIRVGIVSAHVHEHSVWNALVKGWLRHLDRTRFSLHLFAVSPKEDQETAYARSLVSDFETGERGFARWAGAILGQRLDALIYPEIGMDPVTVKLASMRLAPVQIGSWGHPETTGLPTIDYFLSAEGLEPAGAQNNYRERLITLPHLGCHYQPLPVAAAALDLAGMGIDPRAPLLLCPGTPFKYAPEHDQIFAAIARKLGRCQLIFFGYAAEGLTRKLRQRLELAFARAGLKLADYVSFVPWQPRPAFYALMQSARVLLDTIGFSGFNTAMQAVECALPIVAMEGRFLRGRLASGILRQIGLDELIVQSDEAYVELAAKLASDPGYRDEIRGRIETRRRVLYEDMAPVRALEDFLTGTIRRGSPSASTAA